MGDRTEPQFDAWPVCPARFRWLDIFDLACVLPAHHERDGSAAHCDERGNEWTVTDVE